MGDIRKTNLIENRQIRIFISSTFRDMMAERDYLIQNIFPSLRKYCAERDVKLQELDLRWGITEEESQQGKVVDICLKEIKNSTPFFIGLLGERYGWVPNDSEQENIKNTGVFDEYPWIQDKLREGMSITEIEIQDGVLRVEEDVHAYFYFRSPQMEVPEDFKEQPGSAGAIKLENLKKNIREQKKYPVVEYESIIKLGELVEKDIKSLVDKLFHKKGIGGYGKEVYEHDAFIKSRTAVYIPFPELDKKLDLFAESEARGLVISGDSGMGKSALLANWIQKRETRDAKTIYHFIGQTRSSGNYLKIMFWLKLRIWDAYGLIKSDPDGRWPYIGVFLGLIPIIGGFITGHWLIGLIAGPLISLWGLVSALSAHGLGLLSMTLVSVSVALGIYVRHPFIFGLVGVIAGIVFLGIGYHKHQWGRIQKAQNNARKMSGNDTINVNDQEVLGAFQLLENLHYVQEFGRLVIILDGLDKLSDDKAKLLPWLPFSNLPKNMKLVLSTVKDEAVLEHFRSMNCEIVEMPALDAENRKTLIRNYLTQFRKNLTENQTEKLAGDKKNENPLTLITILDELRMFGKFEELDVEIERYLNAENIPDLFKLVLERLEKSNIGKKEFVRDAFSLLYVSENGLFEDEILKLTGNKPLFWSQLFDGMANHLVIIGDKVTFAHNFIREAVKSRYLSQNTEEKQFRKRIAALMKNDTITDNRKYDELSWQYFELENWDDLYNLLLDFSAADYLLQNKEDNFCKYWRALLDIDRQKYDIEKYLSLGTQGRKAKEMSAIFSKMSLFTAESLLDSATSAKFTQKAIDLAGGKEVPGGKLLSIAASYNNSAAAYSKRGDKEKALEFYQKTLAIREKILGKYHADTAMGHNDIGIVYSKMGNYQKALEHHQEALGIRKFSLGKKYRDTVAISYNYIGVNYSKLGDKEKALKHYQKALAIREKVLGKNHRDTAQSYNNIGSVYSKLGNKEKALEFYKEALAIRENLLGENHPDTIQSYNNLSGVYSQLGNKEKAEEFHLKAGGTGKEADK